MKVFHCTRKSRPRFTWIAESRVERRAAAGKSTVQAKSAGQVGSASGFVMALRLRARSLCTATREAAELIRRL
jgi:hypothetical protein